MIDIFNNNIKQNIIEEMKEDLCHSRIDIIKTNINHFVKQFEYINIDTLYSLVVKNINIFNCNKQLFDESIQYLINNDYVEYKKSKKINTILDIIIIRKILEELANSNLIHIKSDEKYLNLYSLKYPTDETAEMIRDLNFSKSRDGLDKDKTRNIDSNMQGWLEFKDFR